jgi:bifunctional UDP-N-acetylglucosamine pyrophosphorylase/glucosamine-1-phosphate N-acetyltransferase
MKLGIIILAAGQGTRMLSAVPKVLHQLAGRPLIAHVLETAQALNAVQIFGVYGYGGEQILAAFSDACTWVEQRERLGTAHAVMQALPAMTASDRVLILYGDVPLITVETLQRFIAETAHARVGLLTMHVQDPTGYGRVIRDEASNVTSIVEQKDATERELAVTEVNTGFMIIDASYLRDSLARITNHNSQNEYYLTDLIEIATRDGMTVATTHAHTPEEVLGINDRVQLAQQERYYQQRLAEQLMRAGTTIIDPMRIDIRGHLVCEQDVMIDINVICEGNVHLADHVSVGANCILKDCEIGAHTEILPHSVIEGARIGSHVRIGPFARIRPGTVIDQQCHIGNFVEIKQSCIAKASKINHLSYIGDTEMGSHVNIGAGTITCNYDGAYKHRTIIGEQAFIGSNTALVAPVEVGAHATIGAGSVISRSAPAEKLTLTRARQKTIEQWQRPVKKS